MSPRNVYPLNVFSLLINRNLDNIHSLFDATHILIFIRLPVPMTPSTMIEQIFHLIIINSFWMSETRVYIGAQDKEDNASSEKA